MYRTDNPLADFDRWDMEQARKEARLPKCSECGERIHTEKCFCFDGVLICPKCMENNHEVWVDDYVE